MSSNRDVPGFLSTVHPKYRVPHRAEILVGAVVTVVTILGDVRTAIGFSSFAVLLYYSVANASAWTLEPNERRWPRALSALGLLGCLALAVALPVASVVGGAAMLAIGVAAYWARRRAG
jgi:APA family basic amino acid/polyamine antiporter